MSDKPKPKSKTQCLAKIQQKVNGFVKNPSVYKNVVRKNYEKLMNSKDDDDQEAKQALIISVKNCKDILASDNKNEQKTILIGFIIATYLYDEIKDMKLDLRDMEPCIEDGVMELIKNPDALEQITCEFFEPIPFIETPLGIAVIVGGSVLLLAIIVLIVMHTTGGKRRSRK